MATTRLIYPPTMKWTEEDERKYAHILSDDPPPVEVVSPERDERKLDAMPRTVVNIGTRNGVTTKVHFQDNESIIERQWDAEPFLKAAAEQRANNQGRTLGDSFESYGIMPPAIMGQAIAEGWIDDGDRVDKWFRENPALSASLISIMTRWSIGSMLSCTARSYALTAIWSCERLTSRISASIRLRPIRSRRI